MRMAKIYWEARIAIVVAMAVVAAVAHALWQNAPPTKNAVAALPIVAFKHERIELARDGYANYVAATRGRNDLTLQLYCGDRLYALQEFTGPRHAELVMFDGTQWRAVPVAPGWILFVTILGCREGHVITWGVQGEGRATFTEMSEFDITAQRATGLVRKASNSAGERLVMRAGNWAVATRVNAEWLLTDINGATLARLPSDDARTSLLLATGELFEPGVEDAWHEQLRGQPAQWWTQSSARNGGKFYRALGTSVTFELAPSGDALTIDGTRIMLPHCNGRLREGDRRDSAQATSTTAGGVSIPVACGYVEFDHHWRRTDGVSRPARIMAAFRNTDWLTNLRVIFALLAPFAIVALQNFARKLDRYVALVLIMVPLQLWAAWAVWYWRSGM